MPEPPRALLPRLVEHVGRHALLDDPPLVHEDHAIAHLAGELHLVRDEHRHPVPRQVAHDHEHLADELRVEAEVTSSKSITCGSIISARAIATRCC